MMPINVSGKVRFSSARPQRVHLIDCTTSSIDLLCMESQQQMQVPATPVVLYVIIGMATITDGDQQVDLEVGHVYAPEPGGNIMNNAEQRLVCLAFTSKS